ncbi:MAG: D-alanyl-D-alanine carboxypeptidase [Elusimicrobia bacterium]|nr:D-alanyl-D-alanine carboxypeptidase [Elusimicrobiota bacterium]
MVTLTLALGLAAAAPASAARNAFPKAAAAYVVERDGKVLWSGNAGKRVQPASLAKMMTALLVIEEGRLDETVTVSRAAARETGTRLGLREGDRVKARDLLTAAIVRSANDACRALADVRRGTEAKFVAAMNARAEALGLKDTRFANACGHDADGQYSTAADIAALAGQVAKKPEYLAAARLERATVRTEGGREFTFDNTNALIGRYPGAVGLKTGTTPGAGTCLAALAERDGVRVLMVLLRARDRWWGGDALLDRAFAADAP